MMTEKVTSSAAYTTATSCAVFGGITANELAAYAGIMLAVLTYLTNLYFQRKRDKREERMANGVANEG